MPVTAPPQRPILFPFVMCENGLTGLLDGLNTFFPCRLGEGAEILISEPLCVKIDSAIGMSIMGSVTCKFTNL